MLGTSSARVPSGLDMSMARPRLTCAGVRSTGLPSRTAKPLFISGIARSALTSANPMMWVKLTLPPRERARWLLMTTRLSMSSLAGTARTLVAVGTWSEDSMLVTTRAAGPRSGATFSVTSASASLGATFTSRGVGLVSGFCSARAVGAELGAACSRVGPSRWRRRSGWPCRGGLGGSGALAAGAGAAWRARPSAAARRGWRAPARPWRAGAALAGAGGPSPQPLALRRFLRWGRARRRASSRRRTPTRPCRPSSCPGGTARTARPPTTRSGRRQLSGSSGRVVRGSATGKTPLSSRQR